MTGEDRKGKNNTKVRGKSGKRLDEEEIRRYTLSKKDTQPHIHLQSTHPHKQVHTCSTLASVALICVSSADDDADDDDVCVSVS